MLLLSMPSEAVFAAIGILGTVLGVWMNLEKKISNIDTRLQVVEKQDDRIMAKLDALADWQEEQFSEMRREINDLKVELQKKANR